MLVFHGTGADRQLLDKLFDEGLRPMPRPWAHTATGIESHVFACTQPIGTRGGDPVAFAQRGAWRGHRAWMLVIDLDDSIPVHGAVPNEELERYWQVRSFAGVAFEKPALLRELVALARERRRPIRELLRYRVDSTADDLADEPDAHSLVQFEQAYLRARTSQKTRVARSYGLRIPTWFTEDSHYPWCFGCMHNLFSVSIEAPEVPGLVFHRGAWDRLDLTTLGNLLDIVDRWLARHGDPHVETLEQLQRRYPPPPELVPRAMWHDFVTRDVTDRMCLPDTQVLLGHVPPERIVGAIEIGDHHRLSPRVRPDRGQTLLGNLRHLTRELVERRERSRVPIALGSG